MAAGRGVWRLLFCGLLVTGLVGCGDGEVADGSAVAAGGGDELVTAGPTLDLAELRRLQREQADLVMAQRAELQRLGEEHRRLLASRPTEPAETPTPSTEDVREQAMLQVAAAAEGIRLEETPGEDWFDPDYGVVFYRSEGGDWTPRAVREGSAYRELFWGDLSGSGLPNFGDESIYRLLARDLVFAAEKVMPLLAEPNPEVVEAFQVNMGWEALPTRDPVIRLWTTFRVRDPGGSRQFLVAGVMRLGVSERRGVAYLTPGSFIGPVVVERLPGF